MAWVLGHSKITFHHAPETVVVRRKDGTDTKLLDICESVTPPCHLNPLLFNGHLQTAWTTFPGADVPIFYKRKIFNAEDSAYEGTFAVDFVVDEYSASDDEQILPRTTLYKKEELEELEAGSLDNRPMLVALHGLSGGSHELYLRHVLAPLVGQENGWVACVVNARGCANSEVTTPVLYNARATWDVRQVVKWLRQRYPHRPLFGIGFSLGANILTNYLGEEGSNCVLKAAVVCANPWNLEIGSKALQRTWIGLNIYSKVMGSSMKKLFEQHADVISKNPRIDLEKVRNIRYLYEFDREVQGPTWGYPTEGAYYRDASSADSVLAVKIPLLAINAEDDPIAVREAIPYGEIEQNPYVVLCTTSMGGHLSWFELGGNRWFAKPACNFLNKMTNEMDLGNTNDESMVMANGSAELEEPKGPHFHPMRRKLHIQV